MQMKLNTKFLFRKAEKSYNPTGEKEHEHGISICERNVSPTFLISLSRIEHKTRYEHRLHRYAR